MAASKIRPRDVVVILDYGEAASGLIYSVMELCVGQVLEQLLRADSNTGSARDTGRTSTRRRDVVGRAQAARGR